MIIKSNTAGKLNKMINGTVFSSEVIFVKEFLQNAQRAKASVVEIKVTDTSIMFNDNGKGCKNPDNLFTLDLSEWESTTEGFGIGFWSCLAVKELISIKVRTYNWSAEVLVEDLLNNNLKVNIIRDLKIKEGFKIELITNPLSLENKNNIEKEVVDVAQYLDFETYYNDSKVSKIDIFSSVSGDYVKEIENRYFKAKLSIHSNPYGSNSFPTLFYDKRKVCQLYSIEFVAGVIEAKSGKIDLKEPDRTDYIWNSKYKDFAKKVCMEIKLMYIDFLKSNPTKALIDTYSDAINHYLDVKDYEKYLDFNGLFDFMKDESNPQDVNVKEEHYQPFVRDLSSYTNKDITKSNLEEDSDISYSYNDNNLNSNSDEEIYSDIIYSTNEVTQNEYVQNGENDIAIEDVKSAFSINDYYIENSHSTSNTESTSNLNNSNHTFNVFNTFKKELKRNHKLVWVLKEDICKYEDVISRAEYVGIKVVKLDNILFANVFEKYNKMHISEFNSSFEETYKFKNISLKNAKEIRAIKNLTPICKKYNLPLNTFVIGDIEINKRVNYRGKTLYKNTTKNKKDKIEVYAVVDKGLIILDRTAMNLSRFKLPKEGPFGINDLKYILSIINTVAHELAHFLCQTKDNTVEHYQTEVKIQEEISKLYI